MVYVLSVYNKKEKYNRITRIPLDFRQGDKFREAAISYINSLLTKGVPSLFSDLSPLYDHPGKQTCWSNLFLSWSIQLGLMGDILIDVSIPKTNEDFRLLYDTKGCFCLHAITGDETKSLLRGRFLLERPVKEERPPSVVVSELNQLTARLVGCNGNTITARFSGPYLFRRLVGRNALLWADYITPLFVIFDGFHSGWKGQFGCVLGCTESFFPVLPSQPESHLHLHPLPPDFFRPHHFRARTRALSRLLISTFRQGCVDLHPFW
ncbi:hypothetical protein E1A91_D06G149000v1 [Gossypium mustelinum]|uniref:Small ribosomal subunit protein eS4 central region domain-containing protein n=1 Tax=Gossypium mustelinum TaxID=34275 RepID=A0A5D2UJ48_GOSMU|nr:hypothetical protein E1A91_D06G149000v1 [Gossypium mustelinum]